MSADKEALSVYVVRHGIVLIDALKRWVDQAPDLPAAELLVSRASFIQERSWWEQFGSDAGLPRLWPSGAPSALPEETFSGPGRLLLKTQAAVLLQWKPFPVIGMIDPFNEGGLRAWCQKNFTLTGAPMEVRTITPHFLDACRAHLQSLPDPDKGPVPPPLPRPDKIDAAAWATLCEVNPEGIADWRDLAGTIADSFLLDTLPPDFLVSAVPIEAIPEAMIVQRSDTVAWLVTAHAHDRRIVDSALQNLGMRVLPFAIAPEDFKRLKETFIPQAPIESDVRATSAWDIDPQMDPDLAGIELYRKLMGAAVRAGASDIHLDPKERRVRVRFRIHGELTEQAPLNIHLHQILLRRLKMQAGMRHDVRGAMQDGSGEFETDDGEITEQRYSIAVAKGGVEAVVIRLLSRKLPKLEDVHLDAASRRAIDWFLDGDGGMFVITGPTGSGKTTTLYACLAKVDVPELKIITVEHPVEKHLPGAVQIDVREDGEVTFKAALKAVVRQDPDILMIGEIRDEESASIAINAALTGHSVFSTIHATDPVGVLERLCQSFNVDRMTAAQALKLVLSQRLVRRLCPLCKEIAPAQAEDLRFFPETDIANPISAKKVGCPACRQTGYAGRIAIAEVLMFDPVMVALVENREPASVLRARNRERGFMPLGQQASILAQTGEITFAEAKLLLPTAQI